jgi:hypothetical protein
VIIFIVDFSIEESMQSKAHNSFPYIRPLHAYTQVGDLLGFDTEFEGLVCEQPAAKPPTVSSIAEL